MGKYVWGFPLTARKAHAFHVADEGKFLARSLCGRWGYHNMRVALMDPETGERSKDDCAQCAKIVTKEPR